MKILLVSVLFCLAAVGCTNDSQPMTPGNEIGGATVGSSFPGSSGANAKNSSGSALGTGSSGVR